jgi:hypothetical protein
VADPNAHERDRIIDLPYTKLMNSYKAVDQSAAPILASVDAAEAGGSGSGIVGCSSTRLVRGKMRRSCLSAASSLTPPTSGALRIEDRVLGLDIDAGRRRGSFTRAPTLRRARQATP